MQHQDMQRPVPQKSREPIQPSEPGSEDHRDFRGRNSRQRLYRPSELPELLRLSARQIRTLERTGQITPIFICGERRYPSREIDELINSYLRVAKRRNRHEDPP